MLLRELFSSPEKWTQNTASRDKDGNRLGEIGIINFISDKLNTPEPCSFCLYGGMMLCYGQILIGSKSHEVYDKIRKYIEKKYGYWSPIAWNDHKDRKFEDIKEMVTELNI